MNFETAKRTFTNRFTMEHVPAWYRRNPNKGLTNGKFYAPQYRTDREWYESTVFPPESGDPNGCISTGQTWPLGHWLDQPYTTR